MAIPSWAKQYMQQKVNEGSLNYDSLGETARSTLKKPAQKPVAAPKLGMGDLRATERPPSNNIGGLRFVERNMPEPAMSTPTPKSFRPLQAVNTGIQEAPLYKPFDKILEKVGIKKVFKSIDDALGIAPPPTEPFKPQGAEYIPYAIGKMIGEAPSVALAYATGGAGAAALTPEASALIPSATQSLSQLATRGAGAGLTHSLLRQAVDPKPISEAIPEIALETAGFMVGDPAANVVGGQVGKFLKPSSLDKIGKLDMTKDAGIGTQINNRASATAENVYYHGTDNDFKNFTLQNSHKNGSYLGNGLYFTKDASIAKRYGKNVHEVILDIKKPLYTSTANNNIAQKEISLEWVQKTLYDIGDYFDEDITSVSGHNYGYKNLAELYNDKKFSDMSIVADVSKRLDKNQLEEFYRRLKDKYGYDGIVSEGETVAFSPEQIKRTTPEQQVLLGPGSISAAKFTIPEKMAPVGNGQKVRSLPVSAMEADYLHPDAKAGLLMETYPGESGVYDAITNKETIAKAREILDSGNAERYVKENPGTALSNTVALNLVKKANIEGRFDDAIDMIEEVAKNATSQGQAIQSLRLWSKMSPEGMQRFYVKIISDANKKTGLNKLRVDKGTMKEIKDRMVEIEKMPEGRQKDVATAQVLDSAVSKVPPSLSKKIATLQTMAQLLNPKTAIRNVGGNLGFAGMENVSDVVGAVIDKPLSLLTGKRSKVMPSIMTQLRGGREGFKLGLEDALKGIDTSGMNTKFDLPEGRVFRGGLLGKAETALNVELRATDRAFYKAAYDESLRNQMAVAKASNPTDEMVNTARLDALYRTFQDDNALSALFSGLKRLMNDPMHTLGFARGRDAYGFGAGDFIIKYPKTPANLLMRGIDYSPAGFVRTLVEIARPLVGKSFNQKAFVESFSRALVGSSTLFGTGILLHRFGVITSRPPKDSDLAEMNRQSGFGDYRINASALKRLVFGDGNTKPQKGDTIVSYDWFQPQAIPLAIGADVDANKGKAEGIVGTLFNALGTGINAFADQPVVQGIQTLFSGGYGQMDKGVLKVLEGIPASFVPTLFNQIKQLTDNQRRETYDPSKGNETINRVTSKIPGLAGNMPLKYGTLGQPLETYPDGGNSPLNVLVNPAFVNKYNPSDEVQRINDIYDQTGETGHIPRIMDKTIKVSGETFQLTGKEYSEYQRLSGQKTQEGFKRISNSMKPEEAAKRMKDIIAEANMNAKAEILKARGVRVFKKGNGLSLPKKREGI